MYTIKKRERTTLIAIFLFSIILFITVHKHEVVDQRKLTVRDISEFYSNTSISRGTETLSFVDTMKTFPWLPYKEAVLSNNSKSIQHFTTLLLLKLVNFLKKSPPEPVNQSCTIPPLEIPSNLQCKRLPKSRKVGMLLKFGFDIDALEIHLHELDAVVDKFFLIESIQAHSSYLTHLIKPLMWDRVKYDARFARFFQKIVHFVVDDANLSKIDYSDAWSGENLQEELRWSKFIQWNNSTKYFGDDDLLGFCDVDEIPNRNNILFLRNCELPSDPIDIGIWFPFGGINTIFKSDFPIRKYANGYTFAEPVFWTVGNARRNQEKSKNVTERIPKPGHSLRYLIGGMHMSRYPYPPFQMTKLLTKTSAKSEGTIQRAIAIGLHYANNRIREANELLNLVPKQLSKRIMNVDTFREMYRDEADAIIKVPWFLNCNQNRFPSFYNEYDERLEAN